MAIYWAGRDGYWAGGSSPGVGSSCAVGSCAAGSQGKVFCCSTERTACSLECAPVPVVDLVLWSPGRRGRAPTEAAGAALNPGCDGIPGRATTYLRSVLRSSGLSREGEGDFDCCDAGTGGRPNDESDFERAPSAGGLA